MPSSATITAFYTFSANAKARASQVNNNFDVFRGHIIPVHVSTVTSANNTYDLGSSEYRWANSYTSVLNLGTTSTSWKIEDATTTSDYLKISQNSTTKFVISKNTGLTLTASVGGFAASPIIQDFNSGSSTGSFTIQVTGSTITITTIGRPVFVGLNCFDVTTGGSFFQINRGLSSGQYGAYLNFVRDGSIIGQQLFQFSSNTTTVQGFIMFSSDVSMIDFPAAGTYNYSLSITTLANSSGRIGHSRTFAFEF